MARMLADIQDSEVGENDWGVAYGLIERDVSRDEVDAVAELVRALARAGDPAAVIGSGGDAGIMLRHILAGVLDEGYARSNDTHQSKQETAA